MRVAVSRFTSSLNKTSEFELIRDHSKVPPSINVAIFATYRANEQAIDDVCHYIENNLSSIIQLPELFFVDDKGTTNDAKKLQQIEHLSKQLIKQVSDELRPFQYVCTSLIIDGLHQAVIISESGLFATQQQLLFCQRYPWAALSEERVNVLNIIELPLEQGYINVAMLTGDDAISPEIMTLAVQKNTHVLLVPFDIQEANAFEQALLCHAAENKLCIVAATREKSFAKSNPSTDDFNNSTKNVFSKNKVKLQKSTGFIANLTTHLNNQLILPTLWKLSTFNDAEYSLMVKHQHGKITKAVIHPRVGTDKVLA
jgi:hypothetical protein